MDWLDTLKDSVVQSLNDMVSKVGNFVPNLIAMLAILIIGWIISKVAQKVATVVLDKIGLDLVAEKIGLAGPLDKANIRLTRLVGRLIFWFFMLTFLMSATETAGLTTLAQMLESFVAFLPNVLAAAVVMILGLLFANFVRDLITRATEGVGFQYGGALGTAAFGILLVVVASVAISQLEVETELINNVVEIFLVAMAAALALALGLGTRDLAKQIVAGVYARDTLQPGTELEVGEDTGRLLEVGSVSTVIRTEAGKLAYIPNSQLTEMIVRAEEPAEA